MCFNNVTVLIFIIAVSIINFIRHDVNIIYNFQMNVKEIKPN